MTESRQPGRPYPDSAEDWDALARHFSGEATPDESAQIESMIAGDPAERQKLESLSNAISRMSDDVPMDLDVESALSRVRSRRDRGNGARTPESVRHVAAGRAHRPGTRWRVPFPAIAATLLAAAGIASWIGLRDRQPAQIAIGQPRMLATGVGVRDSLTLPDGTRVTLGPMSSVSIQRGYGSANREVVMRGDAWFEVVHDESKPFTVRAGAATIVDLGTAFAVRTDAADGVAVTVKEGSVALRGSSTSAAKGVILEAGDLGLLRKNGEVIARRDAATDDDLAWMQGRLVFRDAPLDQVIASVRRWYGIELRVDSSLRGRHITATFDNEPADRVLEVLRLVLGATVVRRGDTAEVSPAGGQSR